MATSTAEIERLVVPIVAETAAYVAGLAVAQAATRDWADAVTGYVKEVTLAFADFSLAQSRIVGLVGDTSENVKAAGKEILSLSVATGKSAVELSEALFFVESSGLRGAKAMSALEVSAKASAAGLGETKSVAQAVVSAMIAYGKTGLTAAEATDTLVAAAREGHVNAATLAGAMSKMMPLAAAMGVSLADLGGQLAFLTQAGNTAAESATQISAVMSTLIKPTDKAVTALAGVGLSFQDLRALAAGPGGLIKVIKIVDQAFGGDIARVGEVFRNIRALRGVTAQLGRDAKDIDHVMEAVRNNAGSTEKAFAAFQDTLSFAMDSAKQAAKGLAIELGEHLAPLASGVAEAFKAAVAAVRSLPPWAKAGAAGLLLLTAGAATVTASVLGLTLAVGLLVAVVGVPALLMGGLAAATLGLAAALAGIVLWVYHAAGGLEWLGEKLREAWTFSQPVRAALGHLALALMNLARAGFAILGAEVRKSLAQFEQWVGSVDWAGWRDAVVLAITAAEVAVKRLPDVFELASVGAQLWMLTIAESVRHALGPQADAVLAHFLNLTSTVFHRAANLGVDAFLWYAEQVRSVMGALMSWVRDTTVAGFANLQQAFANLAGNLGRLPQALSRLLKGEKLTDVLADVWTPLDRGFEDTVKDLDWGKVVKPFSGRLGEVFENLPELGDLPERQIGELEQMLRGRFGNLGADLWKDVEGLFLSRKAGGPFSPENAAAVAREAGKAGKSAGQQFTYGFAKELPKLEAYLVGSAGAARQAFEIQNRLIASREAALAGVDPRKAKQGGGKLFDARQARGPDRGEGGFSKRVEELLAQIAKNTGEPPIEIEEAGA